MKIVILGAGQVGSTVAESRVSEANDITVVDVNAERLKKLQDRLDLRTVTGNAAHPALLEQAGARDADMILAVTQSDEINTVSIATTIILHFASLLHPSAFCLLPSAFCLPPSALSPLQPASRGVMSNATPPDCNQRVVTGLTPHGANLSVRRTLF